MLHEVKGGRAGNISFPGAQISTRLCTDHDIVLTMSKDPVFEFSRPSYPPIYHQLKTPGM